MIKRDSLRDLISIQDRVNRLFEDALNTGKTSGETPKGTWSPAVDIFETQNEFVVKAEVPEIKQSDIEIKVQDNTLTIEGERKLYTATLEGYHRIERAHGRFKRSFLLPGTVNQDNIRATLKDGILTVSLPKMIEVMPKQIEITER